MANQKDQKPEPSEAGRDGASTKSAHAASMPATSPQHQTQVLTPAIADAFAEFGAITTTLGIKPQADEFKASARACKTEPDWCLPKPDCAARYSLTSDQLEVLSGHLEKCDPSIVQ